MEVYNSTIYNCQDGIQRSLGTVIAKNNVAFNNTDDFDGSFTTLDYNASDDDMSGTDPHWIDMGSSTVEWAKAFTDYTNHDFSIKDYFSPLYDAGTNIVIVDDDIIGTARPRDKSTDVGAFEFTGLIPKYRFKEGGEYRIKGNIKFK